MKFIVEVLMHVGGLWHPHFISIIMNQDIFSLHLPIVGQVY